jgi:predicted nucleic acid-binding protein
MLAYLLDTDTVSFILRGQGPAASTAHAFALNVTLVTNNQKHFSKVRGLKIANWSEDAS